MKREMSFANNETFILWSSFMPRRKEISNNISDDLISMQVYPPNFSFTNFDPAIKFEKWAAVEVKNHSFTPAGMEKYILQGGLYAVFDYKGSSGDAGEFFRKIFTEWLPTSGFELDQREHFEILGSKYKRDSAESEEEIWIPVKEII